MTAEIAREVMKYVNSELYELFLGAAQKFQYQMKPQGVAAAAVYAVASYAGYALLPREEANKLFAVAYDAAVKDIESKGQG